MIWFIYSVNTEHFSESSVATLHYTTKDGGVIKLLTSTCLLLCLYARYEPHE